MKVKSFPGPRRLAATVAQGRAVLRGCGHLFRAHWIFALALFVCAVGAGLFLMPYDPALLEKFHFWHGAADETPRAVSWYFGTFGDYPTYNLPLAVAIWLYGVRTKSSAWRRIAVICFIGATLAGIFDDLFRLTLGRPRPDTLAAHPGMADGFYGIACAFSGGYQSFPSGHAAAVFGTACSLLVTELPLGLVTTVFALVVVWARMELDRHYPSDILVGSIIGIYFGLLTGFAAKLRRTRSRRLS